jgi:hypothetical protein
MDARWVLLLIVAPYVAIGFLLLAPVASAWRAGRRLLSLLVLLLAVLVAAGARLLLDSVSTAPGPRLMLPWQ